MHIVHCRVHNLLDFYWKAKKTFKRSSLKQKWRILSKRDMVLKCGTSNIHENFFVASTSLQIYNFAFRRIFFRYNTTVLWIVLNETNTCELGQSDTGSCLGSLSPPWTVQSLVLEGRHAAWDAWVQGCFHFDWRKLRTRSTSQKWHSPCRISPSASHVGCTLKLWREFSQMYSNVYGGTQMQVDIIFRAHQVKEGVG